LRDDADAARQRRGAVLGAQESLGLVAVAIARRPRASAPSAAVAAVATRALPRGAPASATAAGPHAGELLDGLAGDIGVVREPQADAPALAVDLDDAHGDLVPFVEDVLDALYALAGRVAGAVQQTVGALRELDEGAEGGRLDYLANV